MSSRATSEGSDVFSDRLSERHEGHHGPDAGQLVTRQTGNQTANPSTNPISSLFSGLSQRGDSGGSDGVSSLASRNDIPLPIPSTLNLGEFQTRNSDDKFDDMAHIATRESNGIMVEDKRTNPMENVVTL